MWKYFFLYKEKMTKIWKMAHNEKSMMFGTISLTDLSSLSNFL